MVSMLRFLSAFFFCFTFPPKPLTVTVTFLPGSPWALQALSNNNAGSTEACYSTTGNLLHMFYVFDVSRLTDEH